MHSRKRIADGSQPIHIRLVQWNRMLRYERRGREFESLNGCHLYARLTQLEACLPYKEEVGGSSPSASTIDYELVLTVRIKPSVCGQDAAGS